MCMDVCTYACLYVNLNDWRYVNMYVCMKECLYVFICVCRKFKILRIQNVRTYVCVTEYCIVYSTHYTVIVIHTYSTYIHNEIGVCVVREAVGGDQGGGRAHPGLSEEAAQAHADLHAHHRLVSVLHGARVHQREMVQHLPYIHTHTYIHIHKHSILEG